MCSIKPISLSSVFLGQNYLSYSLHITPGDFRLEEPIYVFIYFTFVTYFLLIIDMVFV